MMYLKDFLASLGSDGSRQLRLQIEGREGGLAISESTDHETLVLQSGSEILTVADVFRIARTFPRDPRRTVVVLSLGRQIAPDFAVVRSGPESLILIPPEIITAR
jgi:hypothetical protein